MAANTAKVSVTMGRDALHLAKTMAERTGLSFSSLVTAAVERGLPEVIHDLARLRAADEWIAEMPAATQPSPAEVRTMAELLDRGSPPTPEEVEAAFPRAVETRANPAKKRRRKPTWRKGSRSTPAR
jgi:hypothetical protein